ncbi:MAG: hypothetical protein Kow0077_11910 [Anaerolineae bacterium]
MAQTDRAALPARESLNPATIRRNFFALMMDYVLFGLALTIINPSVMPPDFVARLGGGPVLVGLAGLIFKVLWLMPQLFYAAWVNRAPRKKHYVTLPGIPGRAVFLVAAALMVIVGPSQPAMLIALLLGSVAMLGFFDGQSAVAWMDVIGSSLPNEQRGWMIGWAQAVLGVVVALAISPLVRYVLGPYGLPFPQNYAALLALAGILLLLGLAAYNFVQEGPSPPPEHSPTMREYRAFLVDVLRRDAAFRRYVVMRFAYDLSALGLPFYIVFATRRLRQTSAVAISDQVLLTTLTGIVAALVLGRLNFRYGPRLVIIIAAVAAALGPVLLLSTPLMGVLGLHLMWITIGLVNSTFVPGFLNWVVEYAPQGYRPIYSGMANTIGALALLAPLVGGMIVQLASYEALFIVGAALGGLTLFLALRLPDSRTLNADVSPPAG